MPKFSLGDVYSTPGAMKLLGTKNVSAATLLNRHVDGDWGDLDAHDRKENEISLKRGFRIFSSYLLSDKVENEKVWIITEADRSSTTILLPEEY